MGPRRCASRGSSPTWPPLCATQCAPRVPGSARRHLRSPPVPIPSSNTPSTCLPPSPCSQDPPCRFNRKGLKQNQNPAQLPRNFGLAGLVGGAVVDVVAAHDIVFAQVAADLHFDDLERRLAWVFKAVPLGGDDV